MNEEIEKRLVPLKDFPGYFIDMETHEVWSHLRHGNSKEAIWHKLKPTRGKHPQVFMIKDGKDRTVTLARLVLSVQSGKSYYEMPADLCIFFYNQDKSIRIESRTEDMLKRWERKKKDMHDNRVQETEHHIHCLQLLLEAYKGNAKPLLEYVESRRHDYMHILMRNDLHTLEKAQIGFELAYDRLIKNIERTSCRPYNFDGWFIKTMRCELLTLKEEMRKRVNADWLPQFR